MPFEDLDDAFSEWDESTPIARLARGSQSHAAVVPTTSRTVTLDDPATTRTLAKSTRRRSAPTTLEQALLALADGIPELIPTDC
jgi:hypothetical protein